MNRSENIKAAIDVRSAFQGEAQAVPKQQKPSQSPITLRVTDEERERLKSLAAGMSVSAYIRAMKAHATALKELLVATIAGNHPANPNEINDQEFWACRKFLSYFLASQKGGHVFTLNYDLLLYWTLMHEDNPFGGNAVDLKKNDGFGNDEDDPDADYVVWQGETAAHSANVHFLHGALHLFDSGAELQKYTWISLSQVEL